MYMSGPNVSGAPIHRSPPGDKGLLCPPRPYIDESRCHVCVRWGERAKASELEGKGGKVEVGVVLTLFVRHACVAMAWGVGYTIP